MAVSTDNITNFGRIAVYGNVSVILCTITATATVYATASGGLPIDLTAPLTTGAPSSQPYLNPGDVVGIIPIGTAVGGTAAHFLPGDLAVGTPTYVQATYPFAGGSINAIHPDQMLATCPATIRLWNGATELGEGAVTTVVSFLLVVARGGTNQN